jgi:hypothetical protein
LDAITEGLSKAKNARRPGVKTPTVKNEVSAILSTGPNSPSPSSFDNSLEMIPHGAAYDPSGKLYVNGTTAYTNFPDATVTALNSSLTSLVYGTYIGFGRFGQGVAITTPPPASVSGGSATSKGATH